MADPSAQYWFARRFPADAPRGGVSPVSPEGRRVMLAFAGALVLGAIGLGVLLAIGELALGLTLFVVVAMVGTFWLLSVVARRTDPARTVDDYRRMRQNPLLPR